MREYIISRDQDGIDLITDNMKKMIVFAGYLKVSTFLQWIDQIVTEVDDAFAWFDLNEVIIKKSLTDKSKFSICMPEPISLRVHLTEDIVNHPSHYQSETGLEVIDVIEAFTFDLNGVEATDTGNIIKYICRWSKKNGIEDLEKIIWYTQHLINHVKKMNEENK